MKFSNFYEGSGGAGIVATCLHPHMEEGKVGGDICLSAKAWAQFHGAATHKNLLSLKMFCLANEGYKPKSHAMFIASEWFSVTF